MLNEPYRGLHIPPGIWASEVNFSSEAICLVLASNKYDYLRDYQEFLEFKNETFLPQIIRYPIRKNWGRNNVLAICSCFA